MGNALYIMGFTLVSIWAVAMGFIGYHIGGFVETLFFIVVILTICRIIQARNKFLFNKYKKPIT